MCFFKFCTVPFHPDMLLLPDHFPMGYLYLISIDICSSTVCQNSIFFESLDVGNLNKLISIFNSSVLVLKFCISAHFFKGELQNFL